MDGADEVELDDGRTVQLKEMGNGCYVEVYGDDGREGSQYLLKPKPVFRHIQMLPISTKLKVRLARVLDNAIEWLDSENEDSRQAGGQRPTDEGDGSAKDWFDDTTRADKLLNYADSHWTDEAPGIIRDVAEELARENVMLCNRTGELFTLGNWARPTGSYVATIAAEEANRCPKCGAPKDEFWECIRSSRRTRVPNKYKCQNCGKTKSGITTG